MTFFIWGWFYVTFGVFLKTLYQLDPIKFGAYTAIIEAVGNGIAMISYIYFGSIFVSKTTTKIKKPSSYIETERLLVISGTALSLSLLCISLITHMENNIFLCNKFIVGILIIIYFIGHEGAVIGLMILHVEVTPILQQPRASGIVSMFNCFSVFISQSIIIGPMNSKFYQISFKSEVIILFALSIALLIVVILLNYLMHQNRNRVILQPQIIHNDRYSIRDPILNNINGKSYVKTYHTMNNLNNTPGSTDLILNVNDYTL